MRASWLQGKVIVILGGATGIGAAAARLAVRNGARVVVAGSGCVHRGLETDGAPILCRELDVRDPQSLQELLADVVSVAGRIDVVINCAAILEPGPVSSMTFAAIQRQFDVNAVGTAFVTRTFVPQFQRQGGGHLILVSSLGGIVPLPDSATYSATKFAVRGWGLAVAQEVAHDGVHVTVVCPDSTDTRQLRAEASGAGAPLSFVSRPMTPERVARSILAVIRRPRREISVPAHRAWLCKFAGACPGVVRVTYPLLRWLGSRARNRYQAHDVTSSEPGKAVAT